MITVKRKIEISRQGHGRRKVSPAKKESPEPVGEGRIPRISRLMALAIRLDRMLLTGEVDSVTELARLCHVSQPRMTHILNLTLLAPDIQEQLLFLPCVTSGKPDIHEKLIRPIAAETDWDRQREMWAKVGNLEFAGF